MSTTSNQHPDEPPGDDSNADDRPDDRPVEHGHSADEAEKWRKDAEAHADDKAIDEHDDNCARARRVARRLDELAAADVPTEQQLDDVTDDWKKLNKRIDKTAPALELLSDPVLQAVCDLVRCGGPESVSQLIATVERARMQPFRDDFTPIPDHPADREWLVQGLIPRNRLSAVYGHGEVGKSRLLLQLAAAVTSPEDVPMVQHHPQSPPLPSGAPPAVVHHGDVLLVTWEDEPEEIGRRWSAAHAAGALPHEADRNRVDVLDMRRIGGALWAPRAEGSRHTSTEGTWTETGKRLLATLEQGDYALCVIDPLAAAYACSEIDRALVRAFVSALDEHAEQTKTTIVLVGHPSKSDQDFSGSTDWRNGYRAMLTLRRTETTYTARRPGNGNKNKAQGYALDRNKSNYGPPKKDLIWLCSHYTERTHDRPMELGWFACSERRAAKDHRGGITGDRETDDTAEETPEEQGFS